MPIDRREYFRQYKLKNKEKIREQNREYYLKRKDDENNKKRVAKNQRNYYLKNKERLEESLSEYHRKYYLKHKEELREYKLRYYHKKLKRNDKYILSSRMSHGIRASLKSGKNGNSWESLVPYSVVDLIKHLKKTLPSGYTWEDFISGDLHIDHIIPKSKLNYEKPEDDDFQRCWSLDNLQLLPALKNLKKHNKLDRPIQPSLVFN